MLGLIKVDLASAQVFEVPMDWERGIGNFHEQSTLPPPVVATSDGFLVNLLDGVKRRLAHYTETKSGWTREWITGAHEDHIFGFTASGRKIAYVHSTSNNVLPQIYAADLDQNRIVNPLAVTKLNERLKSLPTTPSEVVHWRGAKSEEVEGILHFPAGYQPGRRYPLIVMPHGGPAGDACSDWWSRSWDGWVYPYHLYTQRGAFVLKVNFHGSLGYGLAFTESIADGRYYDLQIEDIEKGIDALVARGLVAEGRIGTLGWSNGGILSAALTLANPKRYCAAACGGTIVNWISDWGSSDIGEAFDHLYFRKSMPDDPQRYIEQSPLFKLGKVTTPTLILHGKDDTDVTLDQPRQYFRALQHWGKAPTRLLLFPGEGHMFAKPKTEIRKVNEELAWFEKYLFSGFPGK